MPNVTHHRVPKPLNSYTLGAPLLARAGRRVAEQMRRAGGRVVVNGGNCRGNDVNWVHYVHAAYEPTHTAGTGPLRRLRGAWSRRRFLADERRSLQSARIVITNSQRTRRDVIERLGVEPERVRTVYYGIDAASFFPISREQRQVIRAAQGWPLDRPLVALVGALGDRRKGLDVVLTAWRTLYREGAWDAILLVFGSGAQLPQLKSSIERDGLVEHVRFLGYRSDLPHVLRACDALVSPTRYEAFGLGVLEALACGLPALVSADAGVAELYPPELQHLLLPNPDDAADLAQRLRHWRAEADRDEPSVELQRLSETIRARSWDRMAEEFLEAIGVGVGAPVGSTARGQSIR
jgi:glycosyltransferase involved in cell wall biosynthesis